MNTGGTGDQPRPTVFEAARGARRVLFVCLGNICRSPLAQGVTEHLARERAQLDQLTVASRGTGGWHVGDPPDPRTIDVARRNGIALRSRGAQLEPSDLAEFDLVLAMDRSNLAAISRMGCAPGKAHLFLSLIAGELPAGLNLEVPDPYQGGTAEFDACYRLVRAGSERLLDVMFSDA